jgi:PAS domain S-box-containing protein
LKKSSGLPLTGLWVKSTCDFFDPEDCERLKLLTSRFFQEKQPFRRFVNKNIDKNGKIVWLPTNGVPISNDLGELVGYRGSSQNITPFILAEDMLKASEEKYRGLFEASFDAIMLTNPDGSILAANSYACNLLCMSEEEIKKAGRNGIVVQDEKLRVALKEREKNGHVIAEIEFRRKDGTTFLHKYPQSFLKIVKLIFFLL